MLNCNPVGSIFRTFVTESFQFGIRDSKFRITAIQAYRNLGEDPNRGLRQTFESCKVYVDLGGKVAAIGRLAEGT